MPGVRIVSARRWLIGLAAMLLVGPGCTYAVAWRLAIRSIAPPGMLSAAPGLPFIGLAPCFRGTVDAYDFETTGLRRFTYVWGWPYLCLRAEQSEKDLPDGTAVVSTVGIRVPLRGASLGASDSRILLPTRPVWPGFALNSCVFGGPFVVTYMALWARATIRHRVRRRRGQCVRCGYELLAGVVVCPECGDISRPA